MYTVTLCLNKQYNRRIMYTKKGVKIIPQQIRLSIDSRSDTI